MNKDAFLQAFGRELRLVRLEKGLTLEELGERARLDDKHLGRVERGEKLPSILTVYQLYLATGMSVDTVFKRLKDNGDIQD
ncbi:helix-turn-helix transcriptional regulator [Bacillus spongiae]|uniref:Helix-turn-helix transcriptional regulator n=1 Tax=Bacillus spongiae TaxID=2683610 RepID=A0ABU8HIL8_9BACI